MSNWEKRNGIWVSPEKWAAKTADRPHWITILVAVISPLLAVVATAISLQSLKTSRESLEVGQRAYLAIYDSQLQTFLSTEPSMHFTLSPSGFTNPEAVHVEIECQFVIKNLGNTPATIIGIQPTYSRPEKWELANMRSVLTNPGDIPPKSEVPWKYAEFYVLPDAMSAYALAHPPLIKAYNELFWPGWPEAASRVMYLSPNVTVSLRYWDVFKKAHELNWTIYNNSPSRVSLKH